LITTSFLLLSALNLVLESIPELNNSTETNITSPLDYYFEKNINDAFHIIEIICIAWFTLEFLLRFFICANKLKFMISFYNILDLLTFIPFYIWLIFPRIVIIKNIGRTLRILVLIKFTKYSRRLRSLGVVLKNSLIELCLLLFYISVLVLIFSSFIYFAEFEIKNDAYFDDTGFDSIPASFW
jgi:potassium voltage-gated channel Shab-related subfamily B protein 1